MTAVRIAVSQKEAKRQGKRKGRYRSVGETKGAKPPSPNNSLLSSSSSGYACKLCSGHSHTQSHCLSPVISQEARDARMQQLIPCTEPDRQRWITHDPHTRVPYIMTQRAMDALKKLGGGAPHSAGSTLVLTISPRCPTVTRQGGAGSSLGGAAARQLNLRDSPHMGSEVQDEGSPREGESGQGGGVDPTGEPAPQLCRRCNSPNIQCGKCKG